MAPNIPILASAVVLLGGLFYQFVLHDILTITLGVGRHVQPLSDFPYKCRRLYHPKLEACEDMWIDDKTRTLYASCSSVDDRFKWCPAMDALNDTGLGREDRISVLDIDTPGSDGLFNVRQLKPTGGYSGVAGDGVLRLHGFDVEVVDDSTLRFFLVNHRVPVVTKGKPLDADKVGANSTVEVFEVKRGSDDMKYIKTIFDSNIYTPNNIAAMGDGGFVVTNDHSRKRGLRRQLDPIMGGGSVTYCDAASRCNIAKEGGFNFPNGLVRGHDDLVYVPSSSTGQAWVFQLHRSNGTLTQVAQFSLGYPVDNLSVDQRGDIFGAAFPKVLKMLKMFKDPWHATPPGTVIKIVKAKEGYSAEKVLEDNDGKLVSGVTIARHDSKTGRFFLSSPSLPVFTVCEKE